MEREPDNLGRALVDLNMIFTNRIEGFTSASLRQNVNIDAEFKILHLLANYGRLTPSELVAKLCIAKSNLSNQCKMMLKDGLIVQYNDTNDRRVVCYGISAKGRSEYKELLNIIVENFYNVITQISELRVGNDEKLIKESNEEIVQLVTKLGSKIH